MSDTITRSHLTEALYKEVGYSYAESAELVDVVLQEIINGLVEDKEVKLSSFGTFSVREKKERIGRNPKTKIEAKVDARKVAIFHASNLLKKQINNGEE